MMMAHSHLGTPVGTRSLVGRPLAAAPRSLHICQRRPTLIRAEGGGLGGFFKKDDSKQVCYNARNNRQAPPTPPRSFPCYYHDHELTHLTAFCVHFFLLLQDAARKALQEAFQGKKDPFAAEEERRRKEGGGGGGGGGGKGGGGGGSGGGFNFGDFSDGFKKWLSNTARAIAAAALFLGFILLFTLWKPLLDLVSKIVSLEEKNTF